LTETAEMFVVAVTTGYFCITIYIDSLVIKNFPFLKETFLNYVGK